MYILCAIITGISATVSLGFAIQAYAQSRHTNGPALINAKYALSRSLALAVAVCSLIVIHDPGYLIALAITMSAVQLFDGIIGLKISLFKTIGPLLTAIANLIVLSLFLTA